MAENIPLPGEWREVIPGFAWIMSSGVISIDFPGDEDGQEKEEDQGSQAKDDQN